MSFQEKSAWVMLLALAVASFFYCSQIVNLYSVDAQLPAPTLPSLIGFTVTIILISIVGHIVVAIAHPKDARNATDERTRHISQKAGYLASYVLASGVFIGLGLFLLSDSGSVLFYTCFGSLLVSQLVEYTLHVVFNRTAFS